MLIREATSDDNSELLGLQARCPQGTSIIATNINKPDFFTFVKAHEMHKVYIAVEDERIIGSAACAVHNAVVNSKLARVGYLFQAIVAPEHRRKGVATRLLQQGEHYLSRQGADLAYALIVEGNTPSMGCFEKQGYKIHRPLITSSLLVYQQMDTPADRKIRQATPEDLSVIAELLNGMWANYNLYEPTSVEKLTQFIQRTPAYDLKNLWLLEETGEIVACVGVRDWRQVKQITVEAVDWKLRLLGWGLDVVGLFRPMPHTPKPGSVIKQWALINIGFKKPEYLNVLLRHINNRARRDEIELMMTLSEPNHQLLMGLKGFITLTVKFMLYVKPLKPNVTIDDSPIFVDAADL